MLRDQARLHNFDSKSALLQAFEKISLRSKLLAKANTNTKYYGMQKEAQKEIKEENPFPENGE